MENCMDKYKEQFIEFMVDCEVLRFGDFVTKSGRNTPFFINTGFYRTGSQLNRLGKYYLYDLLLRYLCLAFIRFIGGYDKFEPEDHIQNAKASV